MKRITSLGALVAGLVVGLDAPPALAAQGTLAGTWSSIDTDGSSQTLTVTASSDKKVQAGKCFKPKYSNQPPAANTVNRKPSEPHRRTRP